MVTKEDVLLFVKARGPIIPLHIKRELGSDTITIGAILSELTDDKVIRISNTKIGGSPTYYMPEQAVKLQDLKKYLNDKQQKAFDILKQKKVLKDKALEPVMRLSYRDIKDFAIPIEVNTPNGSELYWKWYLTPDSEAEEILRKKLKLDKPAPKPEPKPKQEAKPVQQSFKKEAPRKPVSGDEFISKVHRFFGRNNIEVIEEKVIRRNSEADFIIKVPSAVGSQEYYCRAKNKKKCNDGDLSSSFIQGQVKKLPVIFIYTGEITKKAEEMLDKEFKGMILKRI